MTKDFTVINDNTKEPVGAIRQHSDTYATYLGGSDLVLKFLKDSIPVTHQQMIEVLKGHGYRLEPGLPSWLVHDGYGRRFIPKFFFPPGIVNWITEEEAAS